MSATGDHDNGERIMRSPVRIDHNQRGSGRRGGGRMYAIVFDFDTETLEQLYPNDSWRNAYTDMCNYLTTRGFEWKQGSTYFGDDTVDAVRCVRAVQRLSAKFSWFKPALRDIRMLRIEENNDLKIALDDSDD
jgi:virulence-associated protein VapD